MFSLFLVACAHSFFPTLEEKKHTRKKHEMQRSAQPCVCATGRGSSRTAWTVFVPE